VTAYSDGTVKIGDLVKVKITEASTYDVKGDVVAQINQTGKIPTWR
jgi:ribosomal protein S12 methylthiotransferase